jgi:hypothetical protein
MILFVGKMSLTLLLKLKGEKASEKRFTYLSTPLKKVTEVMEMAL